MHALVPPLLEWFHTNARDLPWRRTRDPYAIWVSEIMLQQTQVKTVIPFYERWMRELPTIHALANATSEKIHKLWEGLGYYTRVRNMQRAAQLVMSSRDGVFPTRFDDVLALPGIGRYTAGAICSIAFNTPTPILDGNVIRVLTRIFGIRDNARDRKTNERLWEIAERLVTAADRIGTPHSTFPPASALNQSLMELGALICTPRAPQCLLCPVGTRCVAYREGLVDELPNLGERAVTTERRFVALLVQRHDAALVRQRPAGVVNGHMWEFPNVEVPVKASLDHVRCAVQSELGCAVETMETLGTIRHSITRYRIAMDVVRVTLSDAPPRSDCGVWKQPREIEELAFTSAHGKAARRWLFSS